MQITKYTLLTMLAITLTGCQLMPTKTIATGQVLGKLVADLPTALYALKDAGISVKGHRDYSPDLNGDGIIQRNEWIKICPGFDVAAWIKGGCVPLETSIV